MNNELWGMFKVSGHVEDYLRFVWGDEKFDNILNCSHSPVAIKDGDLVDWTNKSNGYSA